MLKKVADKVGRNWDYLLLLYVMFAIKEVPQSSTGYFSFEPLSVSHKPDSTRWFCSDLRKLNLIQ